MLPPAYLCPVILIIDNYDSFTYNLVDLLAQQAEVVVYRNDEVGPEVVDELQPQGILISPGPGRPQDSGVSYPIVQRYRGRVPILGVCLGHQLIGEVLGARVVHALRPMHGKVSRIAHDGRGIFTQLEQPLPVMRYHSLVLQADSLPAGVRVCARTEAGEVMAIEAKADQMWGVQFHPESVGSAGGRQLLANWLQSTCG